MSNEITKQANSLSIIESVMNTQNLITEKSCQPSSLEKPPRKKS